MSGVAWWFPVAGMICLVSQKKAVWQAVSTIRHSIVIEWYMRTSHSFMTQDGCTSSNFGKHLSRPVHHHQKETWNSKPDSRKWFGSWTSDNIIFFNFQPFIFETLNPKRVYPLMDVLFFHTSQTFLLIHRSIFSEEHLFRSHRSAKIPVLGGLHLQDPFGDDLQFTETYRIFGGSLMWEVRTPEAVSLYPSNLHGWSWRTGKLTELLNILSFPVSHVSLLDLYIFYLP